ncbi:MAG TPA: polysaccharide biosynthesis C-terminal domain-containing protein [Thermomicrobiaceae bacterium]|nr:polysaccharide biosynthesis C-terminal domain-containing protein [Thermomicrobiaceae bacterium]
MLTAQRLTIWRQRRHGEARNRLSGSFALTDQALISGFNFLFTVLLARAFSSATFGTFAVGYVTLLLANSVQAALVTQPHNVIGPGLKTDEYRVYTSSVLVGQLLLGATLGALVLGAGLILSHLAPISLAFAAALALAVVAWQTQEFVRRVLYTESRFAAALGNDLVSYGGQLALVAVLWRAGLLSPVTVMLGIAASSTAAAVLGIAQVKGSLLRRFPWFAAFPENWNLGKWQVGEQIGYWIASQSYIYLAALLSGREAAGTMRAVLVLLGPLTVIIAYLGTTLPIRLATARHHGAETPDRQLRASVAWTAPLVLLYCVLVSVFATPLLVRVLGSEYRSAAALVPLFALYYAVTYGTVVFSSALRSMRRTREIFRSYVYGALFTGAAGWVFVTRWGASGAVLGMAATTTIICLACGAAYLMTTRCDDRRRRQWPLDAER